MYKRIVLFLIFLGLACGVYAQEKDTTKVEKPAEVPVISYSLTPKKYKIADIKVTGVKNYDDFVLIGFSGLSVGDEITVPGDEVTAAVKRFWKHGLFSDVKILASKIEDDQIWLEIQLKQRPRVSSVNYYGIKKGEREDLEARLGLRKGYQVTPHLIDRATMLIKKFFDEKGFKNVEVDPERNLGIVRIAADCQTAELLWGYSDGGKFTSEFPAHLMSHMARLSVDPSNRVVMHCHPTYTLAMNYVHELDEKKFTHTLWEMCTECIVVFPDGIGVLPWMLCGTNSIGEATAEMMKEFRQVVWGMHGIYGVGKDLDEAFGLIETVEKAAQIYMLTAHLPRVNTIRDEEMVQLAEHFGVKYRKDFLNL